MTVAAVAVAAMAEAAVAEAAMAEAAMAESAAAVAAVPDWLQALLQVARQCLCLTKSARCQVSACASQNA